MGRADTLKNLLSVELGLHNPTPGCDFRKQRELQQMWNLALASMLHIIKPDTTTTSIRDAVMTHTAELTCKECIELRDKRLVKVIHEWSMAPTDARAASIEVKIKKLDGELARYKEQMSKLRNGPGKNAIQQRALRTLKQRKMYEAQLGQLQQQAFNMESAAMTTENLRNTMATVDAMRIANKEMKKQYGKIDIDKIESTHYEMEDLLEQAAEIQESLGRSYEVPDELDEADLEAGTTPPPFLPTSPELDALQLEEEEEGSSYLADLNKVPDFVDEPPVEVHDTPTPQEAAKVTS
ncbi:Vacuolar protein-sorting-associated protein 60 [Marasmius sp. AFHP31]|nr:Vacuolar protein-sorting-associated protein 60 [Marasmius sp. AFHP31]